MSDLMFYNGVQIIESDEPLMSREDMDAHNALTFAAMARARAEWRAEEAEVVGALGIMAATDNDHDADIISRAMALIEMGSYD